MAHDVFISHSARDKQAADSVCFALEARGIRCWIAPRDIREGEKWPAAIVRGIRGTRIFVLVFSRDANVSEPVQNEVAQAADLRKHIICFRIEDVTRNEIEDELKFFLDTRHWMDAITPPLAGHLEKLADTCASVLALEGNADSATRDSGPVRSVSGLPSAQSGGNRVTTAWWSRQRQPVKAGLIVAVVAVLTAAAGTTVHLLRTRSESPSSAAASAVAAAAPAYPAPPPAANAAGPTDSLDALLLTVDQINAAMNTTGMSVAGSMTTMPDNSFLLSDQTCLPLSAATQAKDYQGSGFSAMRGQVVTKAQQNAVDQGVVQFSTGTDAAAFFNSSARAWAACANRTFTLTANGNSQVQTVGPVSDTNGLLSATVTPANSPGTCERALTAAGDVIVDVTTCGGPQGAAVAVAQQIAAKVHAP